MSNRETFPSSLFPLRGDLSAEAGDVIVEVIGLQTVPLGPLVDGGSPVYHAASDIINWELNSSSTPVRINGVGAGDYLISVNTAITINYGMDDFLGVRINGTLDNGVI
jgi:hypothetical protein